MSEITGRRLGTLVAGKCPDCGDARWQPGPQGGASQNFECAFCGHRFNIAMIGNTVIWAHAIDPNGDWIDYRRQFPIGSLFRARGH